MHAAFRFALALGFVAAIPFMAAADQAPGIEGARDWIEALQPPAVRTGPPPATTSRLTAITILPFETGSAVLTAEAKGRLDHLAAALISSELAGYAFEVQWFGDPKDAGSVTQALPERRAAALYGYLLTTPGVSPTAVMLRWARRKPMEFEGKIPADGLLIKVVNIGAF
jgi:outer membrane protein OmpA-like peptidoglycan-associated protein